MTVALRKKMSESSTVTPPSPSPRKCLTSVVPAGVSSIFLSPIVGSDIEIVGEIKRFPGKWRRSAGHSIEGALMTALPVASNCCSALDTATFCWFQFSGLCRSGDYSLSRGAPWRLCHVLRLRSSAGYKQQVSPGRTRWKQRGYCCYCYGIFYIKRFKLNSDRRPNW